VLLEPVSTEDRSYEAGAPEAEIEITPEMIAAGRLALSHYRYDENNEDEIVATICIAMLEARCR
jgi:hypothetical protein